MYALWFAHISTGCFPTFELRFEAQNQTFFFLTFIQHKTT